MSTLSYMPQSPEQIRHRLVASGDNVWLYCAGKEWIRIPYSDGHFFFIPPHLENEPMIPYPKLHPDYGTSKRAKADGRLQIRSIVEPIWKEEQGRGRYNTKKVDFSEGKYAHDIAGFILKHYDKRGVVLLSGDPEQDEIARQRSRQEAYRGKKEWAQQEIDARSRFVAAFRSVPGNQGKMDPPPTEEQRKAAAWMDMSAELVDSRPFRCKYGCTDFDTEAEHDRHMLVTHQEKVEASPVVAENEALKAKLLENNNALAEMMKRLEALETKRGPGRPPKAEEGAPSA